uniref:Vacuolar protein sorting-associated protein 28 homolog n=1 Tax=Meloidogyne javanica TaxID=6303 RepID=A0A915LE39_MELJA
MNNFNAFSVASSSADPPPPPLAESKREEYLAKILHTERRFNDLRLKLHKAKMSQFEKLQDDILNRRCSIFLRRKAQLDSEFDTRRKNLQIIKTLRLDALTRKLNFQREFALNNFEHDKEYTKQQISKKIDEKLEQVENEMKQIEDNFYQEILSSFNKNNNLTTNKSSKQHLGKLKWGINRYLIENNENSKNKKEEDLRKFQVRLFDNNSERDRIDNMSELYAMINALECLEKVYSRDYVPSKEYTAECSKLLVQIKVALRLVPGMSIEEFVRQYRIQCPAALERIREDRPITVRDDKGNQLKCIADIVELFITSLDQLKLNIRAVDELFPNLTELYASINAMSTLPDDFDAKVKVKYWYKLHGMAAHEELSDETARQMIFELEAGYNAFQRFLRSS